MTLILSGTDGLSDVDGTAATPAIRGTDTNTGIFFPAADTIAFSEGGVESMRLDSSGNLLVGTTSASTPGTGFISVANTFGFKNRIINGGMVIDQRNAGAAVTHSGTSNLYVLDRWVCNSTGTPQFSVQRVADAPAGFINSSKLTTTTAGTPAAGDFSYYGQYIEGFNVADLDFGTANAKTVTISFWVKSSLTGTFGGALKNGSVNRAYPFSYVINSANTWEQKSVTIPGDTTGTWTTDNTTGMSVFFDTGSGANNKGTAGAWNATANLGVTGGVNLVATASATWNITGVQLERGSTATSFDFRPYGTELALCQRYFQRLVAGGDFAAFSTGTVVNSNETFLFNQFIVPMRSAPSVTPSTLSNFQIISGGTTTTVTSFINRVGGVVANSYVSINLDAVHAAVLTPGYAGTLINQSSTTPTLSFSSEL